MIWTNEIDDLMREWIKEGLSASEIGDRLGCSRNAVLGRRFRVGITAEEKPPKPVSARPIQTRKPRVDRRSLPESVVLEAFARVEAGMSREKAAASLGISSGNLDRHNWPTRHAHLIPKAREIGEFRREQIRKWLEAGRAVEEERRLAKVKAIAEVNAVVLPTLPERTQEIVHRKIVGETLESIGASLGITRERVRQLCVMAMLKGAVIPGVSLSDVAKKKFSPSPRPRDPATGKRMANWSDEAREANRQRMKARWADPELRKVMQSRVGRPKGKKDALERNPYTFTEEGRKARSEKMKARWAAFKAWEKEHG